MSHVFIMGLYRFYGRTAVVNKCTIVASWFPLFELADGGERSLPACVQKRAHERISGLQSLR